MQRSEQGAVAFKVIDESGSIELFARENRSPSPQSRIMFRALQMTGLRRILLETVGNAVIAACGGHPRCQTRG